MWGKLGTHLTPWRVLNVTPSLAPSPFLPQGMALSRERNTSYTARARASSKREKTLYSVPKASMGQLWFTHCVSICKTVTVNWPFRYTMRTHKHTRMHFHTKILRLDPSLRSSHFGVYKSLYLCLCPHSLCLSYIPKEAITSRASASPWAVVIVTCGLVDMTTPP